MSTETKTEAGTRITIWLRTEVKTALDNWIARQPVAPPASGVINKAILDFIASEDAKTGHRSDERP